jgi:glycosyltransferase involved in cell wall biosynthesis
MKFDRRVNLCLASPHFFPTYGGAQLRFLRYLPGLRERNIFARVITGTPKAQESANTRTNTARDGGAGSSETGLSISELEGVPVHRVRLHDRPGWRRSIAFSQALLQFCGQADSRPDIVQMIPSLQPRSAPWLRWLRRRLGIPIVYGYTVMVEFPANPVKRAFRRWTWRRLYHEMDCVVVGSTVLRDSLREVGIRTRIEVIPNGVDLQRFRPAADESERTECRTALGFTADQRIVTFVGAVSPRKGADLLLEAWLRLAPRFPDAHLVVVGARKDLGRPNLESFARNLEALAQASGSPERIHFPGLVDNVEDYLRASDVFVFPSRREGMPNTVLEAMACGLPVVVCPFLGLPEEFGHSSQGQILVNHASEEIAAGIGTVLEDNGLRTALGTQARRWVEENMDLETSLDRYAALYHELADRARVRVRPRATKAVPILPHATPLAGRFALPRPSPGTPGKVSRKVS